MLDIKKTSMLFRKFKNKLVEVDFNGGHISSNGGAVLLREIDKKLNLTDEVTTCLIDPRDPKKITHSISDMLKQRVYGIALGYEDLNDHSDLRRDLAVLTSMDKEDVGSSPSTLCRFEKYADKDSVLKIHELYFKNFVKSFKKEPKVLELDFDATDDPIYGDQEGKYYHGYYDCYCFLPLYVFCGKHLLVSYLRPSNCDGARHAWAILSLLVKALREKWPKVEIIFRGDSGFCRHKMFDWCEKNNVKYIVGIPGNKVLNELSLEQQTLAALGYDMTKEKQKYFSEFSYAAGTWKKERRIIVKAEFNDRGANTRYIVTNLTDDPEMLYSEKYCVRGNMEQLIDEQFSFNSDRTSCHDWWSNQFRVVLSGLAYILVDTLRRVYLYGTKLDRARCVTIQLKLLRIGATITYNTRRIKIQLSEAYPDKDLFAKLYRRMCPI
jgi:hypothetical protein